LSSFFGDKLSPKKEDKAATVKPGEAKPGVPAAWAEPLQLKVFRLRHRDPQAVMFVAERLIVPVMPAAPAHTGPGKMPAGFGGVGFMGAGFMGGGFMGAGFMGGGFMGQGPPPIPQGREDGQVGFGFTGAVSPRLFADSRARTLLVRGSKDNLQVVTDLVAVLDVPKDKAPPKVKGLRIFALRFVEPETITSAVEQLDIAARLGIVPDTKTLIARGTDAELQEVGQVIEALDVQGEKKKEPDDGAE
jgi:hypothetical protein